MTLPPEKQKEHDDLLKFCLDQSLMLAAFPKGSPKWHETLESSCLAGIRACDIAMGQPVEPLPPPQP